MICSKCGTEITKGGKFCPKCGEPVPAVSGKIKISSSEKGQKQDSGTLQNEQNGMKHLFSKHPKLIFSALAAVMVAVLFVIFKYMALVPIIILLVLFAVIMIKRRILRKIKGKDSQEIAQCALADNEINKLAQYFVSREEKYISSLGNGYIMSFFANGNLRRGFAVISDKRVYFRGSCFSGRGKSLVKTDEERTVDIKDITGSGFIYRRYLGILLGLLISLLILCFGIIRLMYKTQNEYEYYSEYHDKYEYAKKIFNRATKDNEYMSYVDEEGEWVFVEDDKIEWICRLEEIDGFEIIENRRTYYIYRPSMGITLFMVGISCLLFLFLISCFTVFLSYLKKRKTMFQIQYAGGCIAFDVSYYAKAEIDDFQKQLRRAKDLVEESLAKVTVNESPVQSITQNNVPDELRKYSDLLKEGLISQEEYDAMKKKLLGF